jgi:hypothetical protein
VEESSPPAPNPRITIGDGMRLGCGCMLALFIVFVILPAMIIAFGLALGGPVNPPETTPEPQESRSKVEPPLGRCSQKLEKAPGGYIYYV